MIWNTKKCVCGGWQRVEVKPEYGNYHIQNCNKKRKNNQAYTSNHLKRYVPHNLKIPCYSDNEYGEEGPDNDEEENEENTQMTEDGQQKNWQKPDDAQETDPQVQQESDTLPDLPHVRQLFPQLSHDNESVGSCSQMSVDENGLNSNDR